MPQNSPRPAARPRVGLFVTCLVDLFRPSVGFAAVKLLEQAGCEVVVPAAQTCCGQPAWNSGDRRDARGVAETVLDAFADVDYLVAPSGSCALKSGASSPPRTASSMAWSSSPERRSSLRMRAGPWPRRAR